MFVIKMQDITRDGNPVLRKRADSVTFPLSKEYLETANKMMQYLKNSQNKEIAEKYNLRAGVGLAAPQIGLSIQMAAVLVPGPEEKIELEDILINPKIISQSVQISSLKEGEGCLSVDKNIPGYVTRNDRIKIQYQNLKGEKIKLRLKDYPAIVCQHEIDHLKGILFYDHIKKDDPFAIDDNAILIG